MTRALIPSVWSLAAVESPACPAPTIITVGCSPLSWFLNSSQVLREILSPWTTPCGLFFRTDAGNPVSSSRNVYRVKHFHVPDIWRSVTKSRNFCKSLPSSSLASRRIPTPVPTAVSRDKKAWIIPFASIGVWTSLPRRENSQSLIIRHKMFL